MNTKSLPAKVKAVGSADGLADGEFLALVSVFGNIDSMGDVVMPGAFTEDLAAWESKGDPIPVIWSHDWRDPFAHLGSVVKAEETADGLLVHARIEDMDSNPKAAHVYRLLKSRRVTQFSFAYDVLDGGWGDRDGQEVYELRKLHLFEAGPTLVGANQETELLAAKAEQMAAHFKSPGVVPAPAELARLKDAHADLAAILAAAAEAAGAKISDNPANPQREGVPDLDLPPGTAPSDTPTDPPPGRTVDEGSGVVSPDDSENTTSATGQGPSDEAASTEPDGAPPAKSSPFGSSAQVRAWADIQLTVI